MSLAYLEVKFSNIGFHHSREGTAKDFTDHHGFIHGNQESPSEYLINLCEFVKIRYLRKLKVIFSDLLWVY